MVKSTSRDYFAVTPREILNWVVISSEENWRLQLDISISMLWSSSLLNWEFHTVLPQIVFTY